jgi:poly(3-hydroxybutyrate) depolymerase
MGGSASGMGGAGGRGGAPQGGGGGASGSGAGGSGGSMPSAGCGKAAPASMRYSMDVSGTMREYILNVPANYDPMRAYRLVFAWHPLGGNAQQTAGNGNSGYYGLQGASQGAAILVSAEGLQQNGSGNRGWWNTGGGDIAFFRAMIERFKTEMCIDGNRIFSTGFSFGGMMSFSVGCTGLVRAIAPMAGNPQVSGCTAGTTPVAVMGFHGDDDTVVAISGGRQGRDIFLDRNGCMEQGMTVMPSWCDGLNQSNLPCTCTSYPGCTAGYPVTWCEFNGPHTPAPNSATTIWNFFAQF